MAAAVVRCAQIQASYTSYVGRYSLSCVKGNQFPERFKLPAAGVSDGFATDTAASNPNYLLARRKERVVLEIAEAARKVPGGKCHASVEEIRAGFEEMESLLPGFSPNLEAMRPGDWVRLALDAQGVAAKIIMLKGHYPRLDLARTLVRRPKMLLLSYEELDRSAAQVRQLLSRAQDIDRLVGWVPELLEPKSCISILVTVTKWYHLEKDPVEVLEDDPDLVQRAQDNDTPFEPVYMNPDGSWTCPLLNYAEKRTQWQAYIDQTFYKQR